eukprot:GHVU01110994.1.p2 GENE.GHVU01110994.1~~GHVU01110994.1.p2  ORF type:complete len:288 (+),score=40.64 GHVU01110994.1:922-1785(+)
MSDSASNMVKAFRGCVLTPQGDAPAVPPPNGTRAAYDDDNSEDDESEVDEETIRERHEDRENILDEDGNIRFDDLEDFEVVEPEIMEGALVTLSDLLDAESPLSLPTLLRSQGLLPLHGRCGCHQMQLAVATFLKNSIGEGRTLDSFVQQVQDWVGSVRKSIHATQALTDIGVTLSIGNRTRWGSKLRMLDSVETASRLISLNTLQALANPPPDLATLRRLEDMRSVLAVAEGATKAMEADSASAGFVLPVIRQCQEDLQNITVNYRTELPFRAILACKLTEAIQNR